MPHPVLAFWSCAHIPHFRFPTACRQCVPSSPVGKSHFMLTHAEFFCPKIPKTKRQSSGVSGQDRTTIQNSGFHWTSAECEYRPRDCRLQASPSRRPATFLRPTHHPPGGMGWLLFHVCASSSREPQSRRGSGLASRGSPLRADLIWLVPN